ncbi:hypothetical protein B7P43_G13807 [Cryptotermes secundus]|uniref:Uncharacterized protein n=1 Tax=Cryptotermes secundus TaxID=105785 RepID=A0A2J7R9K4_9NEOP|nr:hypothetical protein B7P43_G13807 [Cryptotermes secundus]
MMVATDNIAFWVITWCTLETACVVCCKSESMVDFFQTTNVISLKTALFKLDLRFLQQWL